MSLTFGGATTDKVNIGSAADLDNLTDLTIIGWHYCTTRTSGRCLASKRTATPPNGWTWRLSGTTGDLEWIWPRSGTDLSYITNDTPLDLNAWDFLAITASQTGPTIAMYKGTLSVLATARTFGTTTAGDGTFDSDAALSASIANFAGGTIPFQGRIGFWWMFNRVLSLGEIQSLQFAPRLLTGVLRCFRLGWQDTGTHNDYSGSGATGLVTGTIVADDPPLQRWTRSRPLWMPVSAVAAVTVVGEDSWMPSWAPPEPTVSIW